MASTTMRAKDCASPDGDMATVVDIAAHHMEVIEKGYRRGGIERVRRSARQAMTITFVLTSASRSDIEPQLAGPISQLSIALSEICRPGIPT